MWSHVLRAGTRLDDSTRRLASGGLIVAVVVLAVGHLYVIRDVGGLILGIPTWLWVQLVVLAAMLVMAWVAVELASFGHPDGGEPR